MRLRRERAELEGRPELRLIDSTTIQFRGQKFTLTGAVVHRGHEGLSIGERKKRLTLMALE